MEWSLLFFLNSALLGVGLSMDAFSVSLADGLHEPDMTRKNERHRRGFRLFSGGNADDGVDLRTHVYPVFYGFFRSWCHGLLWRSCCLSAAKCLQTA